MAERKPLVLGDDGLIHELDDVNDSLTVGIPEQILIRGTFTNTTQGQTNFDLGETLNAGLTFVFYQGLQIAQGSDFTVSGSEVILAVGVTVAGDTVDIFSFKGFTVADTYTQGQINTFLASKQDNLPSNTNAGYLLSDDGAGNLSWIAPTGGAWGTITGTLSAQTDLQSALDAKLDDTQLGQASGVASLGADGKLPNSQLPDLSITDTFSAASEGGMLSLSAQQGDICIRSDVDTTYILSGTDPSVLGNWTVLAVTSTGGGVTSVDSRTGAVTLNDLYDNYSSWSFTVDAGTAEVINSGETIDFDSGTGISITNVGNTITFDIAAHSHVKSELPTEIAYEDESNTFTLNQTIQIATGTAQLTIDAQEATSRNSGVLVQKGGLSRWFFGKDASAESTGDAGSDFVITRYDDTGAANGNVLTITRASGDVALSGNISGPNLNISNWDTAYNDSITGVDFATGSGTLSLTQVDTGTLTTNIDGRYELLLGNPAADGYVLTSTLAGARSWTDPATFNPNQNAFAVIDVDSVGQSNIVADSEQTTLNLAEGTGITFTTNDTTKTLTINSTAGQNLFSTIAVSGQTDVVADNTTDTLTFVAGPGMTITTDAGADSITFTPDAIPANLAFTNVNNDFAAIQTVNSGSGIELTIDSAQGYRIDSNTSLGGWARGVVHRDNTAGFRTAGFGFLGSGSDASSFHLGFGDGLSDSSWWSTDSVFEVSNTGNLTLSGTLSASGYNDTNWNTAYDDKVNSISWTGATRELVLNRQDGGTVTQTLTHSHASGDLPSNLAVTDANNSFSVSQLIQANTNSTQQLELRPNSTTFTGYAANILLRYRSSGTANYIGTSSNQIWFGTFNGAIPTDPSDMIIMVPGTDDSPELLIGDSGSSQPKIIIRGSVGGVSSTAGLQNNSFMRTGNIYLHEGGNAPTAANGILSNTSGVLEWDTNTVWHSSNLASEYYSGDLDSITTQGFYFANTSATNKPANSAVLHLPYVNSNDFDSQIAVSHATDSMYFRSKDSGVWESWKEVWHDARNTFSMPAGASLATVGGMYFDIDTDNNSTANFFQWRHNGSTELMTLTDEATLSLGALGTTDSWIRTHYTDGFWTQMRGYGIESNRNTFYIRPAAETQVARFGYHDGNLAWSTAFIDVVSGFYVRGGFTDIDTPDADFIVKDSTDSTTNFIWRDHSASTLYLGAQGSANITARSDILTNNTAYNIGSSGTRFNTGYFQALDVSGTSTFANFTATGSSSRAMLLFNESAPIRQSLSDNYQYLDCVPNSPTNMNRMQFYLPTTAEYSTDNGSNWNPTGWTTEQLGDLMMGRFGGTAIQITNGAWTDLRLVWDTSVTSNPNGYVFLKFLHIYNAPKDNNVSYQVERQDFDTSTWTDLVAQTANQGGWPTHVSLPHTSTAFNNQTGRYKAVRIRFRFTWAGVQDYDLYSINWYGTYPAATHNKVWYWDRDKNFYTRGNIRALDGTAAVPSISFANDIDTGFYSTGVNGEIAVSTANSSQAIFDSSGLRFATSSRIRVNNVESVTSWSGVRNTIELDNNDNYLDFISADAGNDIGIRLRSSNGGVTTRGYLWASDANNNEVGLLTSTGEKGIMCFANGATNLYHNDIEILATTATGVSITGDQTTINATGDSANGFRLLSTVNATNSPRLFFEDQSGDASCIMASNGNMTFRYGAAWNSSSGTIAATMNATTGQFTFNGPLSVNNDTMYINGYIYHNADTNTYFGFPSDDNFRVVTNGSDRLNISSTLAEFNNFVKADYFRVNSTGTILQLENDAWGTEPLHTVMTNGYNTTIQDYLMLKASGNGSSAHGSLIIGDLGLYFGRHNEEDASNIANSTTPFSSSNLFNVNNSGDGFFAGVVTADAFNLSTADGYAAKEFRANVDINNTTYTNVANLTGTNLGSHVRMSVVGTAASVVVSAIFDINVNHSTDVTVKSMSGGYTQLKLRIISDNNEDFSIQLQHDGSTSALTVNVNIYPLNNETVTFSTTAAQTATTHDHQTYPFSSTHTQAGGGAGHHLRTDGRIYLGGDFTNYIDSVGGDYLRAVTQFGYFDFGPRNASYCHLQTDMPEFYFNTGASISGDLTPYSPSGDYDLGSTSEPWAISYVTNSIVNEINDIDTGHTLYRSADNWLRLNPDGDFTSGIYGGSSVLRTDGTFQIGSGGSVFNLNGSTGKITASCAAAGGQGLVLKSTEDQTPGVTFYGPGLLWQDDSANNLAGIRGGRGSDDTTNFLALGTGWLDQEMVIYPSYVDFAAEIRVSTWVTAASGIRHESDTNNNITFGTDTQTFNTDGSARLSITTSAITSSLNHDFSAGIDVTGDITVTGDVDGVDIGASFSGGDIAIAATAPDRVYTNMTHTPQYHFTNYNRSDSTPESLDTYRDAGIYGLHSNTHTNYPSNGSAFDPLLVMKNNSDVGVQVIFPRTGSGAVDGPSTFAFRGWSSGGASWTNWKYGLYSESGVMTSGRVVITDDSNNQCTTSAVTSTELGYLDGVTSAIQTQLDGKQPSGSYLTGITSGDVTTALGYTPYEEGTALSASTGTFTGDVTVGNITFDGSEAIRFESNKHAISWNDGQGNFNIRVANTDQSSTELCTEAGYAFHMEWSQSNGQHQFNVSSASLAVDDPITWRTQILYDTNEVSLRYQGSEKLATTTSGVDVTGTLAASVGVTVGGNSVLTTATSFGGDVSGTYDAIVVEDDSHNHIISNIDGLQTALDGKQAAGNYLLDTTDTFTGTLTINNGALEMSGNEIRDYSIEHFDDAGTSGTWTVNLDNGNSQEAQLSGNITQINITNVPASGSYAEVHLIIQQNATTPVYTAVFGTTTVKWPGGTAYATTTGTTNAIDAVHLWTVDGGSTWYGTFATDFS